MENDPKLQNDKDLIPGIIKLVELLDKYKNIKNVEIEIRLGYIETDPHSFFDTNITQDYYNKINLNPIGAIKKFIFKNFFNIKIVSIGYQLVIQKK